MLHTKEFLRAETDHGKGCCVFSTILYLTVSAHLIKHAQRECDRVLKVLHPMTSDGGRDDRSGHRVIDRGTVGQPEEASLRVQREPHTDLRQLLVLQIHKQGGGEVDGTQDDCVGGRVTWLIGNLEGCMFKRGTE